MLCPPWGPPSLFPTSSPSALGSGHLSPIRLSTGLSTRALDRLKHLVSLLGPFFNPPDQNAPHQHTVLTMRRNRDNHVPRPSRLALGGDECGNMRVHGLDRNHSRHRVRGDHRLERECHQLGTSVL